MKLLIEKMMHSGRTGKVVLIVSLMVGFSMLGISKDFDSEKDSVRNISYSTYSGFDEILNAQDAKYFELVRVSPIGTKKKPMYHGFFFYNCSHQELFQFDPSGRYMLGMRIFVEGRKVQPTDKGEIGIFDLQNNNKWTKIGETTAWNWQQGSRLQWVPGSPEEIIWKDRSKDGKSLLSRIYNMRTKQTRTLPIPVYTISPDGETALSVNFERIDHGGCKYVGIVDPYKNIWAPAEIGVWKMDMKYLYKEPSHHFWLNDEEIMDNGFHEDPITGERVRGYFRFLDDGTGKPKEKYFDAPNGHITLHKNGEWILTDTYSIDGYIYLYMYHIPTKKFVPLGKLAYKLGGYLFPYSPGIFRVDLHHRFSPDGKLVSIDSSPEGFGRQLYLIDIAEIIDNPPQYG